MTLVAENPFSIDGTPRSCRVNDLLRKMCVSEYLAFIDIMLCIYIILCLPNRGSGAITVVVLIVLKQLCEFSVRFPLPVLLPILIDS